MYGGTVTAMAALLLLLMCSSACGEMCSKIETSYVTQLNHGPTSQRWRAYLQYLPPVLRSLAAAQE
jgi:hypothetical protein